MDESSRDSKARAWEKIARHSAFDGCLDESMGEDGPLVDVMIRRLDAVTRPAPAEPDEVWIRTLGDLAQATEGTVALDDSGEAWQKRNSQWRRVRNGHYDPEDFLPFRIFGPLTRPAAAPVRLTDPDDPRIRPGAEVLVTRPYTLVGGLAGSTPNEWSVDGIRSWMRKPGRAEFVLVAEAPDPDADVRRALVEIMAAIGVHDLTSDEATEVIAGLRGRGIPVANVVDITKRADR
jgi:hypothetical protein